MGSFLTKRIRLALVPTRTTNTLVCSSSVLSEPTTSYISNVFLIKIRLLVTTS